MRHGMTMRLSAAAAVALALVSIAQGQFDSVAVQCPATFCDSCGNNGDVREFHCSGLVISTQDNNKAASIDCNGNLLNCSVLPKLSFGEGKQIDTLNIQNCQLNASLECMLSSLNATGPKILTFMWMKSAVSAETLQGMDMVKTLFVMNSGVQTSMPKESLKLLPSLYMLRLSNDGLTEIPTDSFTDGNELNFLEISLNNIPNVPDKAFSSLNKLNVLILYKTGIRTIEANAFYGLNSLKELIMDYNDISDIIPSGMFQHMAQLETISINRNQAKLRLRTGLFSGLLHLNKLELQSHEMELDSDALSGLPSLRTVYMNDSSIMELPSTLFRNTTGIHSLSLRDNKISTIPETVFEGLESLRVLVLSNNLLGSITSKTFAALVNLEEIYLDGNQIEVLPARLFSTIRGLQNVSFAHNNITTISDITFQGASHLLKLDLSYNFLNWSCPVESVPSDSYRVEFEIQSPLTSLDRLKELDLSHNKISAVCSDWNQVMTQLEEINLSYNNLTELTSADMQFGKTKVDLRNNKISTIKSDDYFKNTQLPTLVLGHNPFNCDCQLYDFLLHLKKLPFIMEDAKCQYPASLKDISLDSFVSGKLTSPVSLTNLTCPIPSTPEGCKCVSRPAERRTECVCDEIANKTLPDPVLSSPSFEMLLTLNSVRNLQMIPSFVKHLNLSNLKLKTVPDIPKNVTHVDLSHNSLSRVPLAILRRKLNLLDNPLDCGCGSIEDVVNLFKYNTSIEQFDELTCSDGYKLMQKDPKHLCDIYYAAVYSTSAIAANVILVIFCILIYKYRLEFSSLLSKCGCISDDFRLDLLDKDKTYDLFLSYCHEDEEYVMKFLLPKLDKKYKVCLHTRDFDVGNTIIFNIHKAVANSRRTVMVFSKAFLQSVWCFHEFRAAYIQETTDKRVRAIVILLEDIDLETVPKEIRAYLSMTTYMKRDDPLFWKRLKSSLPRKLHVKDVRIAKVTERAAKNLSGGLNIVYNEEGKLVNAPQLMSPSDLLPKSNLE